jgi:hypothetical protein
MLVQVGLSAGGGTGRLGLSTGYPQAGTIFIMIKRLFDDIFWHIVSPVVRALETTNVSSLFLLLQGKVRRKRVTWWHTTTSRLVASFLQVTVFGRLT